MVQFFPIHLWNDRIWYSNMWGGAYFQPSSHSNIIGTSTYAHMV